MVITAAWQGPGTYSLWKIFSYPAEGGPRAAFAVPTSVGHTLTSAYTVMLTLLMVNFWTIVISLVAYGLWKYRSQKPHPLLPALWNKRASLFDSIIETYQYSKGSGPAQKDNGDEEPKKAWRLLLLLLVLLAYLGQTAMTVVVPPKLILGGAAPVKPEAIYVPVVRELEDNFTTATRYGLEIPPALRALGSVDLANVELRNKVSVSQAISDGQWNGSEPIQRVDYEYRVTGADLGLQRYPDLALTVTGSCRTEYNWHNRTEKRRIGRVSVSVDFYQAFGGEYDVSVFDGAETLAKFVLGREPSKGTLERSNASWAAFVSSVDRTSFSPGSDPWYRTTSTGSTSTGTAYTVNPARPALSCWQDDVWSYRGRTSTAVNLDQIPELQLSQGMRIVLARLMASPMIQHIGSRLGPSSLKSSTTAIGQIFDAQHSSFQADLERLVLASYIATSNILTDSTLYPPGADSVVPNLVKASNGQVSDSVADFIVWSPEVSALDLTVVVVIPCFLTVLWLAALVLLCCRPLNIVGALDSKKMFQVLMTEYPDATLKQGTESGKPEWDL
ncbi:hypothetical protein CDD83_6277 [Cordyceps sp. RAO-2017]|nr:hypothetical protein CDD83_6277 [Cordyceps sp. RAO-2017]